MLLDVLVLIVWALPRLYRTESLKDKCVLEGQVWRLSVDSRGTNKLLSLGKCPGELRTVHLLPVKVHADYRLSVNLLHSPSIFGLGNSQPYLALALWLQWELLVSPVLRGLYCKILVCTTWKGRGSLSSMVFTTSPSLLRETAQTCHFSHLAATAPWSTHLRSSSYPRPNPKLPEGKDRSSTRSPICVEDALLASGQRWLPVSVQDRGMPAGGEAKWECKIWIQKIKMYD